MVIVPGFYSLYGHLCLQAGEILSGRGPNKSGLELGTVLSSDLFDLDDYIKSYLLEHSDMSFATAVKIVLRYYITPELIVQLSEFENHLKTVNYCLFQEVFGKIHKTRKGKGS